MRKTEIQAGVVYAFQERKPALHERPYKPGAVLLLDAQTLYQSPRYGPRGLQVASAGARPQKGGIYGSGVSKTGYLAIFAPAEVLERTDWRALYAGWRKLGEDGLYPATEQPVEGFSEVRIRLVTSLGHLRGLYREALAEWQEKYGIAVAREREATARRVAAQDRGERVQAALREYGLTSARSSYQGGTITLDIADAERLAENLAARTIVPHRPEPEFPMTPMRRPGAPQE